MGRVVDIIPSRDCNIRAAKIKVGKTGAIINRPINKLYPLECSITHDTEDNVNKVNQEDISRRKTEPPLRTSFKENLVMGEGGGGGVLNISLSHVILVYRNIFIARGNYVRLSW